MVGHVQVIRHLEDQLKCFVRVSRRYMDAQGLDGRSRGIQLVAALVIIEQVVGGNAVDLIDESLLQADKFNVRISQRLLNGLPGLIMDTGRLHDGAVGVHGNEHETAALVLCGHCRGRHDGRNQ